MERGAGYRVRTCDPLLVRQMLVPAELIPHMRLRGRLNFHFRLFIPECTTTAEANCLRPKAFHSLSDVLLLTAASFLPMASRATPHRKAVLELTTRLELVTSCLPSKCSTN